MSTEEKLRIPNLMSPSHHHTASAFSTPQSTPQPQPQQIESPTKYTVPEEDESLAIEALGELQNSRPSTPRIPPPMSLSLPEATATSPSPPASDAEQYYDTTNVLESELSHRQRLIKKVRSHPFVDNAVKVYKSNKQYSVEMMEKATQPVVNILEQTSNQWKRKRRLSKTRQMFAEGTVLDKDYTNDQDITDDVEYDEDEDDEDVIQPLHKIQKQKLPSITEALAISNKNLNDFNYHLSSESNKKLATCLQLLMLANKQIVGKVNHLQEIISKERGILQSQIQTNTPNTGTTIDDGEIYHDAQSTPTPEIAQIKTELVTTMKKLVHFLSTHAGSSLPEPARTNVRETLLRLPAKLQNSSTLYTNTNSKVLGLANESLEVVGGIISVFNETLGKAEGWVKERQSVEDKRRTERLIMRSAIWNRMNMKRTDGQGQGQAQQPQGSQDAASG